MPLESGIFHLITHLIELEIDTESEIDGTHLRAAHIKDWQQGIVGKEANSVTTHAERGIQLELVDA